jgi:hypothetical protein
MRSLLPFLALAAACASTEVPGAPPPLAAMEEPLDRVEEPDDEAARAALPRGSFTGLVVGDARRSLDAMLADPEGVLVTGVVENSPAAAAGLEVGDVVLEVAGAETVALHWPSEWRRLELETEPGATLRVVVDRAGAELELELVPVARVAPPRRIETERFREEERVGLVVRTATEVEARAAALGPGGGAVVVGMTRESPWRGRVVYGDLVRAAGGAEVAHPQVLLDAIRSAEPEGELDLELVRGERLVSVSAPLSRRVRETKRFSIPLLWSFERERDTSSTSVLLGLFTFRRTAAAWRMRLLWLITWTRGDADRLEAVER